MYKKRSEFTFIDPQYCLLAHPRGETGKGGAYQDSRFRSKLEKSKMISSPEENVYMVDSWNLLQKFAQVLLNNFLAGHVFPK